MDLEENKDFLYFFDIQMSNENLLLTLTGNMSNVGYTFETRRLLMVLETDETGTADGFSIDYEGGQVGVGNLACQEITMYPNPAKEQLNLVHSTPIRQVDIFNAEGERIHSETPGSEDVTLNISRYPVGIYIVRITTGEGTFVRKFVKL